MTTPAEDEEFTELRDAQIPRVDLVDKAANGLRFLIAKQAEGAPGLMDPEFVRDLIGKAEPEPTPPAEETVTMTGSPAAIAKMIHAAAQRHVTKAKYSTDDRNHMASSGTAMDDGSYPIADEGDLDNAIHAVGRGGADHDAIRRHIISRAKSLDASSKIPDNWNKDGSLKGDVAKETEMADDALDPMTALAEPDSDAPGMDTDPGSPAWEAVDAATARKWTTILSRAKHAIDLLADRELMEAASADPDDAENAWDLQDACCAIDYAISVLAPFAVAEQAEADCGEQMAAVGKALGDFDTAPLDTIEALGVVAKAGRVLSTTNEAAIRGAVESLQKVLASLPQAPTAEEDSGRPVAKEETDMPQTEPSADAETAAGETPTRGTPDVVGKADGEKPEMVAVYDKKGNLVGIVAPEKITRIAGAEADDGDDDKDDAPSDSADDAAADAAPETTDLEPAPAAEVGTPADAAPSDDDNLTKTEPTDNNPTDDTNSDAVLKSSITDMAKRLDDYSTTQTEEITKTRDAVLELVGIVETLKGQVRALEEQPAEPKVFTNGAVPPPHQMRGQDQGAPPIDVAKARDLKQALYKGTASEQNQAAVDMQTAAIEVLQRIHQRQQ